MVLRRPAARTGKPLAKSQRAVGTGTVVTAVAVDSAVGEMQQEWQKIIGIFAEASQVNAFISRGKLSRPPVERIIQRPEPHRRIGLLPKSWLKSASPRSAENKLIRLSTGGFGKPSGQKVPSIATLPESNVRSWSKFAVNRNCPFLTSYRWPLSLNVKEKFPNTVDHRCDRHSVVTELHDPHLTEFVKRGNPSVGMAAYESLPNTDNVNAKTRNTTEYATFI